MIKLGIIGAGPNATGHARKFAAYPERCRIVAVADPVATSAETLADACGARACADAAEFMSDVDAVIVSSPNFLHPEQAIAVAQAGKHVWIEKPMALNDADAQRIVEAVRKAGVASFVGFSVRFDAPVIKLKEIFQSGRLGTPISVWSRRLDYFQPAQWGSWRFDSSKSGGVMSELIAHEIDWMVDLAGDPQSVYSRKASRRHEDPRDNDHIWISLDFGREFTGTIEGSQMSPLPEYYRGVIGSEGAVYTTNWGSQTCFIPAKPRDPETLELGPGFDKHAHFLDVIDSRCASVADVKWGRKIVRISDLAIASAISGQTLKVAS